MRNGIRRALAVQVGLGAAVAAVVYLTQDSGWAAISALYGAGIALLNALLLAWRLERAGAQALNDARTGMMMLYLGALQRFLLTLVGLGVGMGLLGLAPLPMVIAFAITHLGYPFAGPGMVKSGT